MAFTVTQKPTNYVLGSRQDIIYVVVDDTNPGSGSVFKYKYLCDIYIDGTKVGRKTCLPNSADAGVFQINRLVDDYLDPTIANVNSVSSGLYDDAVNTLGNVVGHTGKIFGKNLHSLRRIELKFGFAYASSATADPTFYENQITGEYLTIIKSVRKLSANNAGVDRFFDGELNGFELSGTTNRFISLVPRVNEAPSIIATSFRYDQDIRRGETQVVSFLNDATTSTQTLSPKYIHVAGYQADGTQIFTDSIENVTSAGGENPTTANSDDERLLYFGSGLQNLESQTASSTINSGIDDANLAYYEVVAANSATLTLSQASSAVYRFNVVSECKYPGRRIMFLNRHGGWDFFTFQKRNQKTIELERTDYRRAYGNWDTADGGAVDYGRPYYFPGHRTLSTRALAKEQLQTDWIGEEWNDFFQSLYTSREVYVIEQKSDIDIALRPVVVTDSEYVHQNSLNDKLVSHGLTIQYAQSELDG